MDMNDYVYRNPDIMDERTEAQKIADNALEHLEAFATFTKYTNTLAETLLSKNIDYGNSIFKTGINGVLARIFDKQERIRSLLNNGFEAVGEEKIEDTFEDLAGYAILGLVLLDKHKTFFNEDGTVKGDTNEWTETVWFKELKELMDNAESN